MTTKVEITGFEKLSALLESCAKAASPDVTKKAQKAGAEYFVKVMRSKSAPRGKYSSVHMLDSIAYEQTKGETYIGWVLF